MEFSIYVHRQKKFQAAYFSNICICPADLKTSSYCDLFQVQQYVSFCNEKKPRHLPGFGFCFSLSCLNYSLPLSVKPIQRGTAGV